MVASKRRAPPRSSRRAVNYRDSDTEEDSEDDDFSFSEPAMPEPVKRQAVANTRRKMPVASQMAQRATGTPLTSAKAESKTLPLRRSPPIPSDGLIPAWSTLPYEILFTIFRYASTPLHDGSFNATGFTTWPLKVARVCKAFRDPALAVFYENPPLLSSLAPHNLIEYLAKPAITLDSNNHNRIRNLELDVRTTLAYSAHHKGAPDLGALIRPLSNLSAFNITDETDVAPFTQGRRPKWKYPQALFAELGNSTIRLKAWRLNGNFIPQHDASSPTSIPWKFWADFWGVDKPPSSLQDGDVARRMRSAWLSILHAPSFKALRSLALSNLELEGDQNLLVDAVASLSNLTELTITSCESKGWELLKQMSQNLRILDIQNCNSLDSSTLGKYLSERGRNLQGLVLSHNKALDLGFLRNLKFSCPELRFLTMDFTYYSTMLLSRDTDPTFECLLEAQDIPTWPSTLETLELSYLRKWSSNAAECLFGSLVEAAEDLPFLRALILKAAINIGWRDRAGFRETWISRLQKTFLRTSKPPSPHLASTRAFREWKQAQRLGKSAPTLTATNAANEGVVPPRCIEEQFDNDDAATDGSSSRSRRSRRIKDIAVECHRSAEEHSHAAAEGDDSDVQVIARKDWKKAASGHFQGLCDVVEVTIDNMRPSEVMFNEADFMDSEISGDEDWNGDAEVEDEGRPERHAW